MKDPFERTFDQAKDNCMLVNMNLTMVSLQDDFESVKDLNENMTKWIGLKYDDPGTCDSGATCSLKFFDLTGNPVTYQAYMNEMKADDAAFECGAMEGDGQIVAMDCNEQQTSICQFECDGGKIVEGLLIYMHNLQ